MSPLAKKKRANSALSSRWSFEHKTYTASWPPGPKESTVFSSGVESQKILKSFANLQREHPLKLELLDQRMIEKATKINLSGVISIEFVTSTKILGTSQRNLLFFSLISILYSWGGGTGVGSLGVQVTLPEGSGNSNNGSFKSHLPPLQRIPMLYDHKSNFDAKECDVQYNRARKTTISTSRLLIERDKKWITALVF